MALTGPAYNLGPNIGGRRTHDAQLLVFRSDALATREDDSLRSVRTASITARLIASRRLAGSESGGTG